ncbi:MAG: strawberry notch family protein [Clostridia bacterium]|nr:strawberry notch family protein [Clostridia bacterium]
MGVKQITLDEYNSLRNNPNSSLSKRKMTQSELDEFRKKAKQTNIPLETKDGKNHGNVSYGALIAIESDNLDSYTPKNDDEKRALDDFKKYVDEINKESVGEEQNNPAQQNEPSEKDSFGSWFGKQFMSGISQVNKSFFSTLDFVMPTEFLGKYDFISNLNDYYGGLKDAYDTQAQKSSASRGKGWKTAGDILSGTVAAAPNAILAYMTAGTSLAGNGGVMLGNAASKVSSTTGAAMSSIANKLGTAVKTMSKNPMYWSSVVQTLGNDYEEAKERGANDFVAASTAILTSAVNAGIEIGGGIEKLPDNIKRGGKNAIFDWAKSLLEEGNEEVLQGITTNAMSKLLYDHDAPFFSTSDEKAVINPVKSAKEFGMGAAVGGILGGGQMAASGIINTAETTKTGKFFNKPDIVQAIIDTGLESPEDTQSYKLAKSAQNKKGKLSNYEIGRMYYANVEQINSEEHAAALAEEEASENGSVTDSISETSDMPAFSAKAKKPDMAVMWDDYLNRIGISPDTEAKQAENAPSKKTPIETFTDNLISKIYANSTAAPPASDTENLNAVNNDYVSNGSDMLNVGFLNTYAATFSKALENTPTVKSVGGSRIFATSLIRDITQGIKNPTLEGNRNYTVIRNAFKNIVGNSVSRLYNYRVSEGYTDNSDNSEELQIEAIKNGDFTVFNHKPQVGPDISPETNTSEVVPGKSITLKKVGDFYEAYGDEALLLAEKLGLTPTTKTINGEKVQMVGFPASALMDYQNKSGYMFNIAPVMERRPLTNQEKKVFVYDKDGKIRFKQVDIDYDNYRYREDNFNILVQGKSEVENPKGGIVGKYGVHKKNNGYFGVTLLSSGMDVAAFSTFDEALSFAAYTNKEVSFNDISYVRNAEGQLTIDATPEFMQYGEQIKSIKSEKAYLEATTKEAETPETVTSINEQNMPVTDQNTAANDAVNDIAVNKAENAESVINSQKTEESAAILEENGALPYTDREKANWEKSNSIIVYESEEQFDAFIKEVLSNKNIHKKIYFGKIPDAAAQMVLDKTGVDVFGHNIALKGYEIRKILLYSHGKEATEAPRGQEFVTADDLKNIPSVITDPDNVSLSDKEYEGKPALLFEKNIDGKNYVVAYVSRKHKDIAIQTMYKNKNKKRSLATAENADALPSTPETTSSTASIDSISQEAENVKGLKEISVGKPENTLTEPVKDDIIEGNNIPSGAEQNKAVNEPKSQAIADFIKGKLENGENIPANELFKKANEVYGGTMADNTYTVKDAYDAMELGVNEYILSLDDVSADKMTEILSHLPSETKRTEGQDKFQQFSTPPTIAYLANYAANVNSNDIVLEPSAGIGGIAVFAKKDGAKVYVNELDNRRLEILKNLPFDGFYNENAEQINNILGSEIEPTVVVMNPPFSSSAERNIKTTMIGAKHVEQALKMLAPNGRLVAIVGQGMSDTAPAFRQWWKDIKSEYNVVANVGLDGKNYTKYGTSFGIRMLVIDKTGSTETAPITDNVKTLDELKIILEGVKNGRTVIEHDELSERGEETDTRGKLGESAETRGKTVEQRENKNKSEHNVRDTGSTTDTENAEVTSDVPTGNRGADGGINNNVADRTTDMDSEPSDAAPRSNGNDGENTGAVRNVSGVSDIIEEESRGKDTGNEEFAAANDTDTGKSDKVNADDNGNVEKGKPKKRKELSDSVFESYKTQPLTVKGAKSHPARVSESSAMFSVTPPKLTYVPKLGKHIVEDGVLSEVQIEAVSYAGQAHEKILPDGKRKGFFIGDGTGIGKGRTAAGIILDNYNHGRKKSVWISMNESLMNDARRDVNALFGDDNNMLHQLKGEKGLEKSLAFDDGILYATYSTLGKGVKNKNGKNLEAVINWLGEDFDGVIIFDESHNMKNSGLSEGKFGNVKASGMFLMGMELQNRLPNARIVYSSATGATEVENLRYADRLGLWGEGTAFRDGNDFISKIKNGGVATMEVVASDMKAAGVYLSRNISYDDVKYDRLTHKLTREQKKIYDECARAWQVVLSNIDKALSATNQSKSGQSKKNAYGNFWSSQQRFFNSVISSMQVPSVIEDIEKQLEQGKSCVIQLTSTNEAAQKRELERLKEENLNIEEFDISPKEILMRYVENSFPVQQYEVSVDESGNKTSVPVYDSQGNPVLNREAVRMREEMLDRLGSLRVPTSPIDMIINHFGTDLVAENTGRSKRIVEIDGEVVQQTLGKAFKDSDVKAFQNGDKRIMVFSKAGGTGKSYHADRNAKNQQQRVHYLLEAGWQADAAVQGFGRSHRSNQAVAPIFKLVTTDLKGQMRFISTIAKRLGQLGALTKGQRSAGSQGIFSEDDNLENSLSGLTLRQFYTELLKDEHGKEIIKKLGLENKLVDENGKIRDNASELQDVSKFLNRILVLEVDEQNAVFDEYFSMLKTNTEIAIAAGTFDTGMENYKADGVKINQVTTIYDNPETGATTKYYEFEAKHKNKIYHYEDIIKRIGSDKRFIGFYRNKDTGRLFAVTRVKSESDSRGRIIDNYRFEDQTSVRYTKLVDINNNWEKVRASEEEIKAEWEEQCKTAPKYRTNTLHFINGNLLSIWDKLPDNRVRIYRIMTDDGEQLIGRIIEDRDIDAVLDRFKIKRESKNVNINELIENINNGDTVVLDNGWFISKRRVSGEDRIELSGPNYINSGTVTDLGVFSERIGYTTRYFIPNKTNTKRIINDIIQKVSPVKKIRSSNDIFHSIRRATEGGSESAENMWRADKNPTAETNNGKNQTEIKSISEIVDDIRAKLGIPISTGNFRAERGTKAIYKSHSEAIRTKITNDLPEISHEAGHHIDKLFRFSENELINDVIARTDPDYLEQYPEEERPAEAFGEFFRAYLRNKEVARNISPEFYALFRETLNESVLNGENALKLIDSIADEVNAYMSSPSSTRYESVIVSGEPTLSDKLEQTFSQKAREKARMSIIDSFAPIDRISQTAAEQLGELRGNQNPYILATNTLNAASIASYIVNEGMTDADGNIDIGKGFMDCLKDISSKDLDSFSNYLVLNHALEWIDKGMKVYADDSIEDPIEIQAAIADLDAEHPEFAKAADDVYEYQRQIMYNFLVKTGVVSQELYDTLLEMYPKYVPFYRLKKGRDAAGNRAKASFANQYNPIQLAKSSGAGIINPIESIIRNTEKFVKIGLRNRTMSAIADISEMTEGFGYIIERVAADMKPSAVSVAKYKEMIQDALSEKTPAMADETMDIINEILSDTITDWSPIVRKDKKIVSVLVGGKPQYYQVHDENLYNAVAELTPAQINGLWKASQALMMPMKLLTTQYNIMFGKNNAIRDFQTAYKNTNTVFNLAKFARDYMAAAVDIFRNSEDYQRYKALGGGHSAELSTYINETKKSLKKMYMKDASAMEKLFKLYLNPLMLIQNIAAVNDVVETLPRLAEFKRNKGDLQKAIYEADDITTNFKRSGTSGRKINAVFLFANASIQGLDRTARSFKKSPGNKVGQRIIKYLLSAFIMSLAQAIWNKGEDEEGYKNFSGYMKNNNYLFMIGDGKAIRIPKARELALLDSLFERGIEKYFMENEDAFYEFGDYVIQQLFPPFFPNDFSSGISGMVHSVLGNTVVGPFADILANKDFKGTPIVSKAYKDKVPEGKQYNARTSFIAKFLGDAMWVSPFKIDHVIADYGGIAGKVIKAFNVEAVESGKGAGEVISNMAKNMVINDLTADSNYSTDRINFAFDKRDGFKKKLDKTGNVQSALSYEKYAQLTSYIGEYNKIIRSLPASKQSGARRNMLSAIKNWNFSKSQSDREISAQLKNGTDGTWVMNSLPSSTLEKTESGKKLQYQMTPQQYSIYIKDVLSEVDKNRSDVMKSAAFKKAAEDDKAEMIKDADSKAKKKVKETYVSKLRKEFK